MFQCVIHHLPATKMYFGFAWNSVQEVQGGSNMTGTDLYVNKPHCAAAVRP